MHTTLGAERQAVCKAFSELLKIPINACIVRGCRNNRNFSFRLVQGEEIYIGTAKDILNYNTVTARIFSATFVVPEKEPVDWRGMCNKLKVIIVDYDEENTERLLKWLRECPCTIIYSAQYPKDKRIGGALARTDPLFYYKGQIHVAIRTFSDHVRNYYGIRISNSQIKTFLKNIDFQQKTISGRAPDGNVVNRSYWILPAHLINHPAIPSTQVT